MSFRIIGNTMIRLLILSRSVSRILLIGWIPGVGPEHLHQEFWRKNKM